MKRTSHRIACGLLAAALGAQEPAPATAGPPAAAGKAPVFEAPAAAEPKDTDQRANLNLLGQTKTEAGESRRNENVQFNPIDNNTVKELNVRLGTTATIVEVFRSDRNYFGTEFGNKASPPLHEAALKVSGVHGSAYLTHGNSVFQARSFFQVGEVKPAHQNDYGFSLSAPLARGWNLSADLSQNKIRGNVNGNILVPLPVERIPLTRDPELAQIVSSYMAAYPREVPNRPDIDPRALNTNSQQKINTDIASGRLDRVAGQNRFALRYLYTGQGVQSFQFVADQHPNTRTQAHTARATWNRTWSPRTISDVSIGFDRVSSVLTADPRGPGPVISFGGVIEPLGSGSGLPIDRAQNVYRAGGQVQKIAGQHTIWSGFGLARRQINGSEFSSHRGVLSFRNDFGRDAMTNFRLGIPSRFSGAVGNVHRGFRNWEFAAFAGGDWKATRTFTVNYGLRYVPVTGPTEVDDLTVIPYGCDCNNFAPRLGLAWRAPGDWGMIRAAYGLQYGEIFPVTFQQLRFNLPSNRKFEVQTPDLKTVFDLLNQPVEGGDPRSTVFELDPELSTPYSHQYNFAWERGIGSRWRTQIGYVGSRSHRLLVRWRTNRAVPVPGIPLTTATINDRRPNADFYDIRRILNGSRGYYDAARASIRMNGWRGFGLEAAYWFSKSIDLGADYTNTAAGEEDRARNQSESLFQQDLKGLSSFDQPHAALVRATWQAPPMRQHAVTRWLASDWILSAVILAKSGTPFTVASGSDGPGYGNVDGSTGDRPDLADLAILGRTIGHPDTSTEHLPRTAFTHMRTGSTRGNLGHNTFRKGPIRNVNAAIQRAWPLGNERSLTFRAESVNLTNTPQFAEPSADLTSPSFGQITNTLNDGRSFLFGLRFRF